MYHNNLFENIYVLITYKAFLRNLSQFNYENKDQTNLMKEYEESFGEGVSNCWMVLVYRNIYKYASIDTHNYFM